MGFFLKTWFSKKLQYGQASLMSKTPAAGRIREVLHHYSIGLFNRKLHGMAD